MDRYEHEGVVGEGSYGVVIKCRHKETGQIVAIKKFLETDEDQTVKKIAMREIRMLKRLRHDNLINLIEVFRRRRKLYLVFEYMDHTVLDELEDFPKGIKQETARSHTYQVLKGIEFCHQNNIIHRDVKPENVLVSKLGVVKLCDFGFARLMAAPGEMYTDYVATRWYRAPELLVGDTQYGKEVDIWAIGCLYSEMLSGDPLFPGESDIDQLFQITQLLGPLAAKHRQIVSKNPMFNGLSAPANNNPSHKSLATLFPLWSTESLSFVRSCLHMEPQSRPTCSSLLKSVLFTYDNFHTTFPSQLQVKLQQEFGNNQLTSLGNTGNHHRKKITSGKKGTKAGVGGFGTGPDDINKKDNVMRRRLNSDTFEALMGADLQSKSSIFTGIYSPTKVKSMHHTLHEDMGLKSKIVAPPATLTSEMGRNLSSAKSEVHMVSPVRHLGFQSPDNRQIPSLGLTMSPVRLKRYEGFEQGLNTIPAAKGMPYKNSDPSCLRNKSPPTKKTKRKESHQQSQLLNCVTSAATNSYNNMHHSIVNGGGNNSNSHPLLHQQPSQPPNRLTSIANILTQDNPSSYGEKPILERKFLQEGSTAGEQRFSFLERAFDRAFQFEETLPSTPRDKTMSSSMGNGGTAPPPPSTPSLTTIQSTLTTATPSTPHHNNNSSTKNVTSVGNVSNTSNQVQNIVSTPSNFHHTVLSDANSMLARNLRNRLGPTGTLVGGGGGQTLNFMRNTFGGGLNQGEHLSLPSVAGATFSKVGLGNAMGTHLLGQENHSDHAKGQGNKILSKQKKTGGNGVPQSLNPKDIDGLHVAESRPPSHNLPYV